MKFARTLVVAASVLALATPAIASSGGGGGGGGSMPSSSGRGVDPAKKYAEGVDALKAADYKKAEKAFDQVLDVASKDANTNYMMSLAQIGQQDFKEARKYLRNAVKYQPDFPLARGWLGAVEAKLGDQAKASEQRTALADMKTKCAETCPEAAAINASLARIDTVLAMPDTPLNIAGGLTRFASADGDAAYLAASALINEGRYQDALYSLHAAGLALGPHPDVITYQGFANRKLGNYDVAISYYSAALKLAPEHRGANEYLGEYYVETGQMAKAKAQLVKLDKICAFGCEQAEELRRWIAGNRS